jgi:hypothetical protein
MLGKPHTFGGHAVYVGRLYLLLPVAPDVTVAQVVGQDKDYVRLVT